MDVLIFSSALRAVTGMPLPVVALDWRSQAILPSTHEDFDAGFTGENG
jgi:hypothetical protein